jgi:hypothetical protein
MIASHLQPMLSGALSWASRIGDADDPTSPLHGLCRPDLTTADFFTNDLGRWTPCFIDIAVLGRGGAESVPPQGSVRG